MKERVHIESCSNSVCVTMFLWIVVTDDNCTMNRKNALKIFTSHLLLSNTRFLSYIYRLLRECLDVLFTHLFLHSKGNGSHLLTQSSSIICCFSLYCISNVIYSLQFTYLI